MEIRLAKRKDSKEFIKTQKEAFPNLDSKKQSIYFNIRQKAKQIYAIKEGNQYAGHLCFGVYGMIPPFSNGIFIEEFALKKKFRGRMLGIKLLDKIEEYCKGKNLNMIYLGTGDFKGNKVIKYYKKFGYKIVGKLKDINPLSEYSYGEILMAKVIQTTK